MSDTISWINLVSRPRRFRRTETLRRLVRDVKLSTSDFIYPVFVRYGDNIEDEVPSMPGVYRYSVDRLLVKAKHISNLGIPAILLFGIPENKNELGSEAYAQDGIIQRAVVKLKQSNPDIILITDVCLCGYTDHGHCGLVSEGDVDNDRTLELLSKIAVSHATVGADVVAPSAMMDGQVKAIRTALDKSGFKNTGIMGYSAKFASAFYGPFRDAAESIPKFGDRRGYQLDPPNAKEALKEIRLDIDEGADIVMIKPALPYLDIIYRAKQEFNLPIAAYNVSGEYAMIKAAAANEWLDERKSMIEALTAIKRAGADIIITYFAEEVATLIKNGEV